MADAVTDAAAKLQLGDAGADNAPKLQLDEETGEMVSKGELKKRLAKRAKKASKEKNKEEKKNTPSDLKAAQDAATPKKAREKTEETLDPDSMFKSGFLAEVYKERPVKPVMTRFPPEPNGFLHIGHAKAIAVNFGFAKYHGGHCYLRFDDTNPEAEEEIYFTAIESMVRWLGFDPYKITYSSDNFDRLYETAEKLITLGKAYVCHCGDDDLKLQRGGEKGASPRFRCAHADQSVEENIKKFRGMRDGEYKPREAFLRMKQDITDGNPQMWDLAAYRVLDKPHHRTGSKWVIYPTYDFTHCLCDAFEGITHSLCTTEFFLSRTSYEWLNDTVEVEHKPMQREYGRLSISGAVLSKRKLKELVDKKYVRGWDDPRLYTLIAVRRRGIPPAAILEFVSELGVTTTNSIIQSARFEQTIRRYLERTVPRLMLVLDPVPVVIEDAGEFEGTELTVPFSPKNPAMGDHKIKFTKTVYIDRSDFREVDSKEFYRLAPGKSVGLLGAYVIKATSFTKNPETGKVTEIRAVLDNEGKKPKTFIQWVSADSTSRKCEVRIHHQLFLSENPQAAEGGYLSDINPNSEEVYPDAIVESGFDEAKRRAPWPEAAGETDGTHSGPESVRFQAMRVGYFAMDSDSTEDKIVLNRIVSLKEDKEKN
ncbi:tRNA synthetases class I, catalytic domain-containing protein [Apodospora peruviana]|uniref:glutamine--tRNA ligase n=1 Tax=Apodospora peruviana TaxID=516989 RepID=A0AAE0I3X6_9PEZI|nr:tRNA synthetases class I, catalytic domain-containing protein [Apodospora peruviana]